MLTSCPALVCLCAKRPLVNPPWADWNFVRGPFLFLLSDFGLHLTRNGRNRPRSIVATSVQLDATAVWTTQFQLHFSYLEADG